MTRILLVCAAILVATVIDASAQTAPVLRASVSVNGDVVRIGDFVDNAGSAAQVAIFRAPDLGTTGAVPAALVLEALRANSVYGVDTGGIRDVMVTREARTLTQKEIEAEVARAIERRNGLGDAANLALTFDRDVRMIQLEPSHRSGLTAIASRYEPRTGRFDVTLEIASEATTPTRLRFTGTVIETVEAAVVTRSVERGEILKSSDVATERRPKAEVGAGALTRERLIGMQLRKGLRAGQHLRSADIAKAELVQRDQTVSLLYETPGIYLTMRGKAMESGAEGDTVSVMNLQSKRVVQGTVTAPGLVTMAPVTPRLSASLALDAPTVPVATAE